MIKTTLCSKTFPTFWFPNSQVTLTFELLTSNLLSQLFVSPLNSKFLRISSFM